MQVRGHSNNTWNFFGTFLPPPCDILLLIKTVFKDLLVSSFKKVFFKANIYLRHNFLLPKALKSELKKRKKVHVTFCSPPLECHVLFEWPLKELTREWHTLYYINQNLIIKKMEKKERNIKVFLVGWMTIVK